MSKKVFFVPQVEDETVVKQTTNVETSNPKQEKKYQPEAFVSSIYGKNVVDNAYYQGVKYENKGRQYDSFREKDKRVVEDDFKEYIIPRDIFSKENKNKKEEKEELSTYL